MSPERTWRIKVTVKTFEQYVNLFTTFQCDTTRETYITCTIHFCRINSNSLPVQITLSIDYNVSQYDVFGLFKRASHFNTLQLTFEKKNKNLGSRKVDILKCNKVISIRR